MRMLPEVAVVVPRGVPLILATVGEGKKPERSPLAAPVGAAPEIVVVVREVILPSSSTVTRTVSVEEPYVPAETAVEANSLAPMELAGMEREPVTVRLVVVALVRVRPAKVGELVVVRCWPVLKAS